MKAYRQANKEKARAYNKAYNEANKEKKKAHDKAYRERNKEKIKAYREANKEKLKAYNKAWQEVNKEYFKTHNKAWNEANKEKRKEYMKAYRGVHAKANPGMKTANETKRRASKLNRTPSWLTKEDFAKMKDMYRIAKRRSEVEGIQYHVDHIIPLRGKNVSGLHVPNNLQILRARDNLSKGNRYG